MTFTNSWIQSFEKWVSVCQGDPLKGPHSYSVRFPLQEGGFASGADGCRSFSLLPCAGGGCGQGSCCLVILETLLCLRLKLPLSPWLVSPQGDGEEGICCRPVERRCGFFPVCLQTSTTRDQRPCTCVFTAAGSHTHAAHLLPSSLICVNSQSGFR